jgi:hypothetical protein
MTNTYALVKNNIVANVVLADDGFIAGIASDWDRIEKINDDQDQLVAIGWSWSAKAGFTPPEPVVPKAVWEITKLAFKNRFPRAKWMAAKQAIGDFAVAADFFESFELAASIHLDRKDTQDMVNAMATSAVPSEARLTPEEAALILEVPAGAAEQRQTP